MKIVYKITYPNGKIYVGKDLTNTITYFGSPDTRLIAADFSEDDRRSFSITREILSSSETASDRETHEAETGFILLLRSNDPAIGCNRRPSLARASPYGSAA